MRLRSRRASDGDLPFGTEYVPGLGVVSTFSQEQRWQLAGEYAAIHRSTGPWFRRVCAACGTRRRCPYGRWSDDVLTAQARREWLGR